MPEMHRYLPEAEKKLGRHPVSADDIVVMVSEVLYDYLPPDSGLSSEEALGRLLKRREHELPLRGRSRAEAVGLGLLTSQVRLIGKQ